MPEQLPLSMPASCCSSSSAGRGRSATALPRGGLCQTNVPACSPHSAIQLPRLNGSSFRFTIRHTKRRKPQQGPTTKLSRL